MKKIFELNKDMAIVENKERIFLEVEVEIPDDIEKRYKGLCLFTEIQVFEEEKLTYNQCSLNLSHKIVKIDWDNNPINKVSFQYVINEKPGFAYKLLT